LVHLLGSFSTTTAEAGLILDCFILVFIFLVLFILILNSMNEEFFTGVYQLTMHYPSI
jgi:hypothetical protein